MDEIHLMQANLNLVNMARWAAEARHSDPERTAHCLLAESFGQERAPRPFVVKVREDNGGRPVGTLLAYTREGAGTLTKLAERRQKLAHAAGTGPRDHQDHASSQWMEKGTETEVRNQGQAHQAQLGTAGRRQWEGTGHFHRSPGGLHPS